MPDNERQRIMDEIYRRQQIQDLKNELRRRGVDPQMEGAVKRAQGMRGSQMGAPPQVPGQQQPPADDPLVYRGNVLPLGKTQSGRVVPAVPAPIMEGAEVTKRMVEGGPPPTGGEATRLGAMGLPLTPGARISGKAWSATAEELGAAKKEFYSAADRAGVGFTPQSFARLVGEIGKELAKDTTGFHPKLQPQGQALLEAVQQEAAKGGPISLTKLDTLRKLARGVFNKKPRDENEQRIAQIIIDKIDDFFDRAGPQDVTGGDPQSAVGSLKMAREIALRERKVEILDDIFERADLNKGDLRQSGYENALRREFKKLATPGNKEFGKFSKEEQEAIKDAAKTGEGFQKFLIGWGNAFSPTAGALGKVTGAGAAAGAYASNPLYLLLPASGYAAKWAAGRMRANAVGRVEDLVRGGAGAGDVRFQRALRDKKRAIGLTRALSIGGAPALLGGQEDDFNPLTHPNQL